VCGNDLASTANPTATPPFHAEPSKAKRDPSNDIAPWGTKTYVVKESNSHQLN
jgi:hypothetical protein